MSKYVVINNGKVLGRTDNGITMVHPSLADSILVLHTLGMAQRMADQFNGQVCLFTNGQVYAIA